MHVLYLYDMTMRSNCECLIYRIFMHGISFFFCAYLGVRRLLQKALHFELSMNSKSNVACLKGYYRGLLLLCALSMAQKQVPHPQHIKSLTAHVNRDVLLLNPLLATLPLVIAPGTFMCVIECTFSYE